MTPSPLLPLLGWCAFLALLSMVILVRTMPPRVLVACVLVKFLITVVYFCWFADGAWVLVDDLTYLRQGLDLAGQGYTPLTVVLSKKGLTELIVLSEGLHVLYGWFNLLAVTLIGPYYFSPVILNVFVTSVTARVLWGFARDAGFGPRYASALAAFYLLHWDVVAWSAVVNMKDSVVVLLTLLLLRPLSRFLVKPSRRELFKVLAASVLVFWIRFYIPAIAGLAMLLRAGATGRLKPRHRGITLAVAAVAVAAMAWIISSRWLALILRYLQFSPLDIGLGLVRMILTPQPWSVAPEYGFLVIPSILHLVMLGPTVVGVVKLWREAPLLRLSIVYAGLVILLYAAFPIQQGSRYRHQVAFILVWAQFTFLWHLFRATAARPAAAHYSLGSTT